MSRRGGRSPASIAILTVLIDIVAFGMILPILPGYADRLGSSPFAIGALVASYSAIQFVLAPFWGRVSDRFGRRRILLLGLLGSVGSYLIFAVADSYLLLFISRILDGGSGATISIAQAYVADETESKDRARAMGKIGAAFGIGFVIGPMIGGISAEHGYLYTGFVAAALCLANLIFAWWALPESNRTPTPAPTPLAPGSFRRLASPLTVLFLATLAFTAVYVVFPLYAESDLSADRRTIGMWFAMIALATAAVQGGLIGRLVPRFGEVGVARWGALILASGFLLLHPAAMSGSISFGAVLMLIGAGYGMGGPAMLGLISRMSGEEHQGSTMGLAQSTSAMARIVGPPIAGLVMQHGGAPRAFITAAVIAAAAFAATMTVTAAATAER